MKVLIIGATGFVGRSLVKNLAEHGHDAWAFSRNEKNTEQLSELGVPIKEGDLSRLDAIPDLVKDFDAVILTAQLTFGDEYDLVAGILDAMEGSNRCFVMTSGTTLMSIRTDGKWDERSFAEDDEFVPRKQIAPRLKTEELVRNAADRGVRAMVVRPPLIWGHGGCQIISEFYHSARKTGAVCYIGPGLNVYSNIHVDDLAEVYRLCIERGKAGALYYSVTGEVSFGVMARTIADELGVPSRSVTVEEAIDIWGKGLATIVLPSCSRQKCPRTREELGWAPDESRLDILEECRNPAYAQEEERPVPSWMKPGLVKGRQYS